MVAGIPVGQQGTIAMIHDSLGEELNCVTGSNLELNWKLKYFPLLPIADLFANLAFLHLVSHQ